ncbi:hypothetical protein [Janthinobacterium sp. 75]|uniref:hypothetical protein n=1 Tax=Janthinobacterium sp. 75 TaxID=2135628 RepID=UPI001417010D|nr:hypothetical protein [Janthinobacterium sp. 75]
MTDMNKPGNTPVTAPLPAPAVRHAEPTRGGSYIRDMTTGDLVQAERAPGAPSAKEKP